MKKIPLTKGKFAIVDDEDYDFLMQWKWCFCLGYALRGQHIDGKLKKIRMHRFIMHPPPDMQIDHIDGDKLNNQKSNLRICTRMQNSMNRFSYRGSSSPFKGVAWHKINKKWVAYIRVNKKLIRLGDFSREEDAATAYNFAAMEHFGEFARLNKAA